MGYNLNVLLSIFLTNRKITFFIHKCQKKASKIEHKFQQSHFNISQQKKKEEKRTAQTKNLRIFAGSNVKNIQKQI